MFKVFICALALAVVARAGSVASKVKDQKADLYVFAQFWEAESCYASNSYPGCADPDEFWEKYFTIHGLWPQYSDGGYPSYCTDEAFNPDSPEAVGLDDMYQRWPNIQSATTDSDYEEFWEHEWTKHGTCSGMTQTNWFNATMNLGAFYPTPSLVTSNIGGTVSASDLRDAMGGADKVSLQCDSGMYLAGAFSCWSMGSGNVPETLITCPTDVQGEDTCTSTTLQVPSF